MTYLPGASSRFRRVEPYSWPLMRTRSSWTFERMVSEPTGAAMTVSKLVACSCEGAAAVSYGVEGIGYRAATIVCDVSVVESGVAANGVVISGSASVVVSEASAKMASSCATGVGRLLAGLDAVLFAHWGKSSAGKAANAESSGASGFLMCAKPAVSSSIKARALINNRGLRSTMAVIHALQFCYL